MSKADTAVLVVVLLGSAAVRTVWQGRQELRSGDRAAAKGHEFAAIVHYRRAAQWYAPGAGWVEQSLQQLRRLGTAAERRGDLEQALMAWRAIRAAILSTRSAITPHPELLRQADAHIASLMARHQVPPMDRGKSLTALRQEHLQLLQNAAADRPQPLWTACALLGFALWLGGAWWLLQRAYDAAGAWQTRRAWPSAACIFIGLVLFVVGLAQA